MDAFTETFSSAHLCCNACAYKSFPITLPGEQRAEKEGGKGRAAGCHTGAQNVKWASAAVET